VQYADLNSRQDVSCVFRINMRLGRRQSIRKITLSKSARGKANGSGRVNELK
jgi:hypothetical protein